MPYYRKGSKVAYSPHKTEVGWEWVGHYELVVKLPAQALAALEKAEKKRELLIIDTA